MRTMVDGVATVGTIPATAVDAPAEATGTGRRTPDVADVILAAERPQNRIAHGAMQSLTRLLSRRWRLTIDGLEQLPASGPVILAANHMSFVDSPLLMFCLPRRVWFLGKAEYMDSWRTRHLFPAVGMIPIERGGRRGALSALRAALGVLEHGQVIGIYPEGTRSRDGKLHRGHTGLGWLALRSGAPIVPVGIRGTAEVQPPDTALPKLAGDCHIAIGREIPMSRYTARDRRTQRSVTDDVMFEISQLSGQQYVDQYAEPPEPAESDL
jgi:1-acyl-sn-glycerol-3-phosphate acyltransferase